MEEQTPQAKSFQHEVQLANKSQSPVTSRVYGKKMSGFQDLTSVPPFGIGRKSG